MKPKRLIAPALVLLGGIFVLFIIDKPPVLPAAMILPSGPLAVKSGRVPDRWIPAKWGWLHRACQFFLGAPRQVGFHIQFIETSATVASIVAQHSLGQPQAESNGVAIWILPPGTLRPPLGQATIVSAPRVITADRMEAMETTTGSAASCSADLFARLEEGAIDLSTRLDVTEAGQTNSAAPARVQRKWNRLHFNIGGGQTTFFAAVRAQLPYGQTLFVLDVRQPESVTNRMECRITADEMDPAGNIVQRKTGGK